MKKSETFSTPIPTQWIGPIKINGAVVNEEISVPLATYETPLWPSVDRGARVSRKSGGIKCTIIDERMTRSIALRVDNAEEASEAWKAISTRQHEIEAIIEGTSRYAKLLNLNHQIIGNILYIRIECSTGDASGHNMVTKAADAVLSWILEQYPQLNYSSISGNYCIDKKASAVNGILGRG